MFLYREMLLLTVFFDTLSVVYFNDWYNISIFYINIKSVILLGVHCFQGTQGDGKRGKSSRTKAWENVLII